MLAALLLLATPAPQTGRDVACMYVSRTNREMVAANDCARIGPHAGFQLNPLRLRDFAFDKNGLGIFNTSGTWHYVRRDGSFQPVMAFDNWAEGFQYGLARSEVNGKIGYIDRRLRLVLPRIYDGAYPFTNGGALVCFGCTRQSDGEHSFYSGGDWTCIDTRGRELRPRQHFEPGQINKMTCNYID